jgi:glycosyltransferase involved in cell wall biosynthesis
MKSLHLVKTAVGARWALRQIKILVSLGVDVSVAMPGQGPMVGEYLKIGASEHYLQTDLPVREPWQINRILKNLRSLINRVKPDIIHSHFVGTTLSMRLALGATVNIPRIFQVPGPLHLEHLLFRNIEMLTASNQDYWIGSCRWTCNRYKQAGVDSDKIFLSYYGTDMDQLSPIHPGKLRKELQINSNSKIVGMVAFMYAPKRYLGQAKGLKGHEDLIDAVKLCLGKNKNIYCVMVGGAWNGAHMYEKQIRKYAHKKCGDRIIFLGHRNDVADLYAGFDIAVHPSHSENVGGAVESLALNVPTIATAVGGFPDVVKDGKTGWLVPPNDPLSLSTAIIDALNHPGDAKIRAAAGQKLVRNLFDVNRTASEIKSIYQKILSIA